MSFRRSSLTTAAAFVWLALHSNPCHAAPSPKDKQEARTLVADAKKAMKAGSAGDAVTALRRADELDPSPQTKLDLATALAQDKKLIDASGVLRAAIEGGGTTWNDKKAVDAAKKALAELEPKIPRMAIVVGGDAAAKATATVDGKAFELTSEAPVDPGDHAIVVEADGFARLEKTVTVAESAHEKFELQLTRNAKNEKPPEGEGGSRAPAIAAFGVGAAGLIVGGVFGVLAFSETSDAEAKCTPSATGGSVCPGSQRNAVDSAKTKGTISTIGFAVGGVGVAAGVVLLLVRKSGPPAAEQGLVHPYVGLGEAGVYGSF